MKIEDLKLPRNKVDIENSYTMYMAPFATIKPVEGSREYNGEKDDEENRSDFQRDRDRIIHSKAFRRLMYKTQVFVNHESDHFRTRLTHTLEVAQFARGVCKSLALNEDLAEAIALGHDLGHTPFGHAVERYLDSELKTRDMGRFNHNEQSVRVVDFIEKRNSESKGLNLTKEVREGILKHNEDRSGNIYLNLTPDFPCSSLEGQIVKIVDTVAYICHDLQDGIKSGLVQKAMSNNMDFRVDIDNIEKIILSILPHYKKISFSPYEPTYFIKELIHYFIMSITNKSYDNIKEKNISSLEDVKLYANKKIALIEMKEEDKNLFNKLKKLTTKSIYGIYTIETMDSKAITVIRDLFNAFINNPKLLPPHELYKYNHIDNPDNYYGFVNNEIHVICDYISCMTDRYALDEHERIFNPRIKI